MKQITSYIFEGLRINKDTKIDHKLNDFSAQIGILNEKINNLNDLKNIIEEFFKPFNIKISKIDSSYTRWIKQSTKPNAKEKIEVKDHFEVQFLDGQNNVRKKLKFGIFGSKIIMQLDIKSYTGKFEPGKIHGRFQKCEFNIGDNFLDFMLKIKELTDQKDIYVKDPELINLFHLNKNEEH